MARVVSKPVTRIRRYAEGTPVTLDQSADEARHIAERFDLPPPEVTTGETGMMITFEKAGRRYCMTTAWPSLTAWKGSHPMQTATEARAAWKAEKQRKARTLVMAFKTGLDLTADDPALFRQHFQPFTLLPDGRIVHSEVEPVIERILQLGPGHAPALPLLPAPAG